MGPLPELGKWVRLSVTAKKIGLKPMAKVNGMAFTQWDGTIYWDKVGVLSKMAPRRIPSFHSTNGSRSPKMINPYPGISKL
jgi:hypothetical protein